MIRPFIFRTFLTLIASLFLAGCATIPLPTRSHHTGKDGPLGDCADFFGDLDREVRHAGVIDSGYFRVKGYPYLRIDRFLASFRGEVGQGASFDAWLNQMQILDRKARSFEIANLPESAIARLSATGSASGLEKTVSNCGDRLKALEFQDPETRSDLTRTVTVPDEYITTRKILGIYPITRQFVSRGVLKWHAEARQNFSLNPPSGWDTIRYIPKDKPHGVALRSIMASAHRDALNIPHFDSEGLDALFRIYAPVWEVRLESEADRIGAPFWAGEGKLGVDSNRPVTYTYLSFTRFGTSVLTQLNYIIWFPSRPKKSAFDIYGGFLDGLNYRITLDADGRPLLYESMHNCGCYYKAYSTTRLKVREVNDYLEPPLIFIAPEVNPSREYMTIAMANRTHYVQGIYPASRGQDLGPEQYPLVSYGQLRSLSLTTGGRRSMFNSYGIVSGSERLERYFLWPTGVLSPGAMRQWGRHAVAFSGVRHFDDPDFMDNVFILGGE